LVDFCAQVFFSGEAQLGEDEEIEDLGTFNRYGKISFSVP
jgi:hypothetical protein